MKTNPVVAILLAATIGFAACKKKEASEDLDKHIQAKAHEVKQDIVMQAEEATAKAEELKLEAEKKAAEAKAAAEAEMQKAKDAAANKVNEVVSGAADTAQPAPTTAQPPMPAN